jgi:hypothetical protein
MTQHCTALWLLLLWSIFSSPRAHTEAFDSAAVADPVARAKRLQVAHIAMSMPATAAAAEAQLFGELERMRGMALTQVERDALQTLQATPVWSTVAHPEGLGLRLPKYPVAQRAKGLLVADRERAESAQSSALLTQPQSWLAALLAAQSPSAWIAPLHEEGIAVPAALRAALGNCAQAQSRCANALLALGPGLTGTEFENAAQLADADAQLRFVQQLDPTNVAHQALLQLASEHVQTRSLALQKRASLDDQLQLLGDAERGAELASALAKRLDADLLQRLKLRYDSSRSTLEQQRVLLVLRLSTLPAAQVAFEQWSQSDASLAQTLQAVRSW